MEFLDQKIFNFYHIIDTSDEMRAHPGLERERKKKRFRNNQSRASWSGRIGPARPGLAGPVHNGYRLYGKKNVVP